MPFPRSPQVLPSPHAHDDATLAASAPIAQRTALRRAVSVVLAFVIALVVLSQGIAAPFIKDQEPQSAQWVVDIVHNGHWLVPHDYYDFVDRKPPLYYWIAALVTDASAGRVNEVTARSPSLIAGAALAAEVMAWTALEVGAAEGWLAFFFLLGIYGYASRAATALTDMLLTFLLFSAWFMVYPQLDGEASRRRTFGAGAILGLAILTKGPIAIVLLALAGFIYLLSLRRNPLALARRGWPWLMLAVGSALAAMWYVPAFIAGRGSDLTGVFIDENFGHFLPASMGGTGEAARPFYYIVMRMFGGSLPLSLLVLALIVAFAAGGFTLKLRKPMRFQLAMALAVIVLFSAASAKRDDYILPALPAFAIMFATLFATGVAVVSSEMGSGAHARPNYTALIRDFTTGAIAVVMLAGVTAGIFYFGTGGNLGAWHLRLQTSDATYAAILSHGLGRLALPFVISVCGVVLGALAIFAGLWRGRTIWTGAGLALICLAGTMLWTGTLRPAEARTRSLNLFAAEVRRRAGDTPVYVVTDNPGLAYYYGRAVPSLPRAVKRGIAMPVTSFYLVARRRELVQLSSALRNRLRVVSISHVMGGGGPPVLYMYAPAALSVSGG